MLKKIISGWLGIADQSLAIQWLQADTAEAIASHTEQIAKTGKDIAFVQEQIVTLPFHLRPEQRQYGDILIQLATLYEDVDELRHQMDGLELSQQVLEGLLTLKKQLEEGGE